MLAVRTNNLFLALLVKIKVLVAYAVSKNYVVVILLIILSYTVYSHSIVAGGLLVMSYTTRLT